MELLTPWHLALVLLGFVLLFGYKRLPDASRSFGRSLRIFKSEMRELSDSGSPPAEGSQVAGSHVPPAPTSVQELERQAEQAEAEARALRARAEGRAPS